MQIVNKKNHYLNNFLMILVFAVGGINFFNLNIWILLAFFIFTLIVFIWKKKTIGKSILIVILIISIIVTVQTLKFGKGSAYTLITFIIKYIAPPYFVLKIIGPKFPKYFVNTVYLFSIIGLFFYFSVIIFPGFKELMLTLPTLLKTDPGKYKESIIIYSLENMYTYGILRNSGQFHEPGGYAVYLILALIFNSFEETSFKSKKNVVLIFCLLSTISTAGYFAFFIIIIGKILLSKISNSRKIIVVPVLIVLIIFSFQNLAFLNDKVQDQLQTAVDSDINQITGGRFFSARKSVITILRYPVFGKGFQKVNEPGEFSDESTSYGVMGLLAKLGIPAFLLFSFYMYKALSNYFKKYKKNNLNAIYALFAIYCVLFAQGYYFHPIFIMLMFTPLVYSKYFENAEIKNQYLYLQETKSLT